MREYYHNICIEAFFIGILPEDEIYLPSSIFSFYMSIEIIIVRCILPNSSLLLCCFQLIIRAMLLLLFIASGMIYLPFRLLKATPFTRRAFGWILSSLCKIKFLKLRDRIFSPIFLSFFFFLFLLFSPFGVSPLFTGTMILLSDIFPLYLQ